VAKLSTQFYATASEVTLFVQDVIRKHHVEATLVHKVPFSIERVTSHDQLSESAVAAADWVVFTTEPIAESAHPSGFRLAHPDAMMLEVGRLDGSGLRESWLHALSESASAMALWSRVARDLRRMTYAGVAVVDGTTGAIGPVLPAWRCTAGARDLYLRGVTILPAAGKTRLAIVEPPGARSK